MDKIIKIFDEKLKVIRELFVSLVKEDMAKEKRIEKLEADIIAINRWIEKKDYTEWEADHPNKPF